MQRVLIGLVLAACGSPKPPRSPARPAPPRSDVQRPSPSEQLEPDRVRAPEAELKTHSITLDLPAVPSFELPPGEPGFIDPKTLRVAGKKLLDTDVKVKGYIVWIYDCITAIQTRNESAKQTQKRIDAD